MKKALIIFLAVVVLAVVAYFLLRNGNNGSSSSGTFIKPEISLATLKINSIEDGVITMDLSAVVDNKLPIALKVDSLQYEVLMEGTMVAQSSRPDSLNIGASQSSTISLPVTLYQEQINQILQRVENSPDDSVNLQFNTAFFVGIPLKEGPVDLSFSTKFPFVRQPEFSIEDISIEKFGFDQSEVELLVQVINPNQLSFSLRQTDYDFQVDDKKIAYGQISKATSIPSADTATFLIPFNVNLDEVGENVFNLLFKPNQTNYSISISSTLESKSDIINNSTIKIKKSGKLQELIN